MPSIKTKQTPINNSVFNKGKKKHNKLSRFSNLSSSSSQLTPTQISNVLGMKALLISDKSKIKRGKGKQAFAFN